MNSSGEGRGSGPQPIDKGYGGAVADRPARGHDRARARVDQGVRELPEARRRGRRERPNPSLPGSRVTGFPTLPGVGADVIKHLHQALSTSLGVVFTNAWNKRQEIRKYADPVRYPPQSVNRVTLAPQKVTWQTIPTVEISVNDGPAKSIDFTFEVTVRFELAELQIQAGRLMGMTTGKTSVEGKLTCGGAELLKRKVGDYVLPGEIKFGEGIPILSE